ncbi:hypothetical protein [Lysinibacillus sp. K60]|nr:hypothetical protein [Lysinibacillus sp. K60]MBX8942462.1 hypothetical protein [Lysinibacillus sp. K60]
MKTTNLQWRAEKSDDCRTEKLLEAISKTVAMWSARWSQMNAGDSNED